MDGQKGAVAGRHADGATGVDMVGERHIVVTHRHDSPDLKGTVNIESLPALRQHGSVVNQLSFVGQSTSHTLCYVTDEMGKPGSDAGMPGIEDSEVGKIDDVQFGKH